MVTYYMLTSTEALIYGLGSMLFGIIMGVVAVYATPKLAPFIIKVCYAARSKGDE